LNLTGPVCGDGAVNGPEACDDMNTVTETSCAYGTPNCNICNGNCTALIPRTGPFCGDNIVNGTGPDLETCDDGNTTTEAVCPYGSPTCSRCDATCDIALSLIGPFCGDGTVSGSEACDDRNANACGTCNASCTANQPLAAATGTIRTESEQNVADGETFTLNDGTTAVVFCFKTAAMNSACTMSQVAIDVSETGNLNTSAMGDAIVSAINGAAGFGITASKRGNQPFVGLTNDEIGGRGNVAGSETVADADFVLTGMASGGGADCPVTIGCNTGNDCASGTCTANACQ
jgi:cysteine-rich repeat protein